jgi:hypothetical protein
MQVRLEAAVGFVVVGNQVGQQRLFRAHVGGPAAIIAAVE